jgi:Replication-relaxation
VYGLSGLGFAVLNPAADHRHRRVPETKLAYQSHVLAVSELGVALTERSRSGHCVLDEFRAEPGCWRWFDSIGGRRALKPDAYVRLDVEGYELSAFIEQDMDTESLPAIRRKLDVYVDYWRTGTEQHQHGVFPRVWWLVPDSHRLHAITDTIRQLSTDARELFTVALTDDTPDRLTQLPQLEGGTR